MVKINRYADSPVTEVKLVIRKWMMITSHAAVGNNILPVKVSWVKALLHSELQDMAWRYLLSLSALIMHKAITMILEYHGYES